MKEITVTKILTAEDRARGLAVVETVYRILLILDIARAWRRLKERDNKVWKELGEGLPAFTA